MRIGITCNVRSSESAHSDIGLAGDAEEEFDSPETVQAIAETLRTLGHEVEIFGDGEPLLRRLLSPPRPDLVFNFAEGTGIARSREARVPALLDMLGIPYTGSDPLTLAVALDKPIAKLLVAAAGIAVPRGVAVPYDPVHYQANHERLPPATRTELAALTLPAIAKPAFEGSSKGVLSLSLIDDPQQLEPAILQLSRAYRQPILVEEFIAGDEITVGVVGNSPPQVLGVMRILPAQPDSRFVYSLEVKRDFENQVRYEAPPRLPSSAIQALESAAIAAYRALGCRDVARIDFRLRDGVPWFIEANPLPGLSPKSGDLVILAGLVGLAHRDLVGKIVDAACQRLGTSASASQAAVFPLAS